MFLIDKDLKKPLYQQLVESIENAVECGHLRGGDKLPSERALSQMLGVNRSTIVRAFDALSERNIIVRKIGAGSFINTQKWGLLTYPTLNWRQPNLPIENSIRQGETIALTSKNNYLDLSNGDLPIDLYPALHLPEMDWQTLISAEQQELSARFGMTSLRECVQTYLKKRFNKTVPLDQILITSGTQQAISLISIGLLNPGDAIAIESPSYFYALPIFQSVGLRIYGIPMDHHGIMIDQLDQLVHKHSIKMIFTNPCFQNPTGILFSPKRKEALLHYVQRKNLPLVEDDAYSQLYFYSGLETSPLSFMQSCENAIYLGSLSKYLGKSIRIGWIVAPPAIIQTLANIRHQLDSGLSTLPQLMAEHYLNHYADTHEDFLRRELKARSIACAQYITQRFGNEVYFDPPQGGFHLYLYPKKSDHKSSNQTIFDRLKSHSILSLEGSFFGETRSPSPVRMSIAHFKHSS